MNEGVCAQDHAEGEPAPEAAGDNAHDLKAKLAKIKRQALTFKAKLAEASAARDAALEELKALKVPSKNPQTLLEGLCPTPQGIRPNTHGPSPPSSHS